MTTKRRGCIICKVDTITLAYAGSLAKMILPFLGRAVLQVTISTLIVAIELLQVMTHWEHLIGQVFPKEADGLLQV